MKRIVLLSTKTIDPRANEDLLLVKELSSLGFEAQIQSWEDLKDNGEDLFLLRTTWNYFEHYDDFLSKLEPVKERLLNPFSLVQWNSNKKYLRELADQGLQVAPVQIVNDRNELSDGLLALGGEEFVLKPTIGASSIGLKRFHKDSPPEVEGESLLQRFYPEISTGEVSMIFFSGEFSYAIKKVPKAGDIRVQVEYGGNYSVYEPTDDDMSIAKEVLSSVRYDWLYARVDILPGVGLMELECIEPSLYFTNYPEGAKLMAQKIAERIKSC